MKVIQRSPCEFSGKQMGTISEESLADRMMKMGVEPTSANSRVLISQPHAANHHIGTVGTVGR